MAAIFSGTFLSASASELEFDDSSKKFNIGKGDHHITIKNWYVEPTGSISLMGGGKIQFTTTLKFTQNKNVPTEWSAPFKLTSDGVSVYAQILLNKNYKFNPSTGTPTKDQMSAPAVFSIY